MSDIDLSQVALADLIVELLLDGRAGHRDAQLPFEPISVTGILAELHRRTGESHGASMDAWRDWFLNRYSAANELDRLKVQYADTRRKILKIEQRVLRKFE